MRRPSEFIVWNHVLMAYETYRASMADRVLFCLALPCTLLSVLRHLHHEKCCNTVEPILAKTTMVYLTIANRSLNATQLAVSVASKALIVSVWMIEDYNYELIHPWLHILVALDAHFYINCLAD